MRVPYPNRTERIRPGERRAHRTWRVLPPSVIDVPRPVAAAHPPHGPARTSAGPPRTGRAHDTTG